MLADRILVSGSPEQTDGWDVQLLYFTCPSLSSDEGRLEWIPLCKHRSDWLGQDAHPHPVYNHAGDAIYFNSRDGRYVKVYKVNVSGPGRS